MDLELADVDAVEQDPPFLDVVEAQQKLDQGGLAGAGVADDGQELTGADWKLTSRRTQSSSAGAVPPR